MKSNQLLKIHLLRLTLEAKHNQQPDFSKWQNKIKKNPAQGDQYTYAEVVNCRMVRIEWYSRIKSHSRCTIPELTSGIKALSQVTSMETLTCTPILRNVTRGNRLNRLSRHKMMICHHLLKLCIDQILEIEGI